jgi:3-phenylpropionate/cinnamic acid dioxygenase small subunit
MSETSPLHDVEQFLFREASYMDNHDYERWLALWDTDPLYWVPCNNDDVDPMAQISIIYDRREQLEQRVKRMKGHLAHAQSPRSRLMRVVSNVQILGATPNQISVSSAFVVGESRLDVQTVWIGRSIHTLTRRGGDFLMKQKKVLLLNNASPLGNLQFLI